MNIVSKYIKSLQKLILKQSIFFSLIWGIIWFLCPLNSLLLIHLLIPNSNRFNGVASVSTQNISSSSFSFTGNLLNQPVEFYFFQMSGSTKIVFESIENIGKLSFQCDKLNDQVGYFLNCSSKRHLILNWFITLDKQHSNAKMEV